MYMYIHPVILRTASVGRQTPFIVNHFQLLYAENNRYKLQLVQLCLFVAAMPAQMAESRKPLSS